MNTPYQATIRRIGSFNKYVARKAMEITMEEYTDLFRPNFLKREKETALPADPKPTMAYVPLQIELITYDYDKGLCEGTIFPELNKPFSGKMVKKV